MRAKRAALAMNKEQKLWHIRIIHEQQKLKHSVKFYFNVATMMHQMLLSLFPADDVGSENQLLIVNRSSKKKQSRRFTWTESEILQNELLIIFRLIFNVIYSTCVHMKMTLSLYFYSFSSQKTKLLRILFRRISLTFFSDVKSSPVGWIFHVCIFMNSESKLFAVLRLVQLKNIFLIQRGCPATKHTFSSTKWLFVASKTLL